MNIPNVYKRIAIALCVVVGAGVASYKIAISPCLANIEQINSAVAEKEKDMPDTEDLIARKDSLQSQNAQLLAEIAKYQKDYVHYDAMTSEEMLMFISNSSKAQNLALVAFYDYGIKTTGQAWSGQYNLELRGDLNGLRNFVQSLDSLNMRYSVGGMSLIENVPSVVGVGDYTYRYFDGLTSMPWFGSTSEIGRTSYEDLTEVSAVASNTAPGKPTTSAPLNTNSTVSDWANAPEHDPNAAFNAATQSYKSNKYDVSLLTNDLATDNAAVENVENIITDVLEGIGPDGLITEENVSGESDDAMDWMQEEEVTNIPKPPVFNNVIVPDTGIYTLDLTLNFMMYKDPETGEFEDMTDLNTVTDTVS